LSSIEDLAEDGIFDEMSDRGLYELMCGGDVLLPVCASARVKAAREWRRRYPGRGPLLFGWQVQAGRLALHIVQEADAGE